jgi:hypothetical protein
MFGVRQWNLEDSKLMFFKEANSISSVFLRKLNDLLGIWVKHKDQVLKAKGWRFTLRLEAIEVFWRVKAVT